MTAENDPVERAFVPIGTFDVFTAEGRWRARRARWERERDGAVPIRAVEQVSVPNRAPRSPGEIPPAAAKFARAVMARGWKGVTLYSCGAGVEACSLRMAYEAGGDPLAVRAVAVWHRAAGSARWSVDEAYGWVPGQGPPLKAGIRALQAWMAEGGDLGEVAARLKRERKRLMSTLTLEITEPMYQRSRTDMDWWLGKHDLGTGDHFVRPNLLVIDTEQGLVTLQVRAPETGEVDEVTVVAVEPIPRFVGDDGKIVEPS